MKFHRPCWGTLGHRDNQVGALVLAVEGSGENLTSAGGGGWG